MTLWPGLPVAMLLWRLPQVSLRPQAFEGSSPEMVRTQGRFHCPFCQTCPPHPSSGSWHLPGPGLAPFSVALICPQHPSAQVLPPAELSPTPCPKDTTRQGLPTSALHSDSGQPPPDQHWDRPLSLQPTQAVPEKPLCCVTGTVAGRRCLGISCVCCICALLLTDTGPLRRPVLTRAKLPLEAALGVAFSALFLPWACPLIFLAWPVCLQAEGAWLFTKRRER